MKNKQSHKKPPPGPGPGRPKGSLNKTTAVLKDAILAGATAVGEDGNGRDGLEGYCRYLAKKEPRAFAGLMGKVLPMTVTGDPNNPMRVVFETIYEQKAK